jgi:transaldolase/glucose-6-phosphate isomerase
LGMTLGEEAKQGRDKVTIVLPDEYSTFGLWVEQLIAESTGKQSTGCIPVPTTQPEEGPDRHVVPLHPASPDDLAEQFYRWEVAVAVCGHVLGIDPFDEPNVAESKKNTSNVLDHLPVPEIASEDPSGVYEWLSQNVAAGDYVSLQTYLPYGQDDRLEQLRRSVRDRLGGLAVTAGYGPRFLHSTGQLHKGGPNSVLAVQIVERTPGPRLPIPGKPYDFGTLITAQSVGDHQSLVAHGRRVLRVAVDDISEIG